MRYEVLENEVNHIKNNIKEIKIDTKETNKYYRETIDALKENVLLQTQIMNNQKQQTEFNFKETNRTVELVKEDMDELKENINNTIVAQTKWYQKLIENFGGKFLKIVIIILAIIGGIKGLVPNEVIIKLFTGF